MRHGSHPLAPAARGHRLQILAILTISGLLASACNDVVLRNRDELAQEPLLIEERFDQAGPMQLDLLFVVDDTSSMAQEQDVLAASFAALPAALDELELSWQVGVAAMDGGGEASGVLVGDPWIITTEVDDAEEALARASDVGTAGLPPEAGLLAVLNALSEPLASGLNRGFRRPGAALHVVVVSDEDDQSEDLLDESPSALVEALLAQEAAASAQPALLSAVVGPEPEGCSGSDGSRAKAGSTYLALAEATGGLSLSICEADFGPLLEEVGQLSVVWPDRFPLQAEPVDDTVVVRLDGTRLDAGWFVEHDPAMLVFELPPAAGSEILVRYEVAEEADGTP